MRMILGLMLLASVSGGAARACDVCGCSASGQYLGVLPKADLNFVGIQYLHNRFRSEHPSLFDNRADERAQDYYNTAQLWGRFSPVRRLQLFAFLPYRYNMQLSDTGRTSMSGIGDISVLANAVLLRDDPAAPGWQQQLLAGGGVKLPTGAYTGVTERDKNGLPNMQPGTGSWDFLLNLNYTLRRRNTGVNLDASYTLTTPTPDRYKYGNRLNAGLLAFRAFSAGRFSLMPQLGVRYEYALYDYDDIDRRWLNRQSGGYMCFAGLGLQVWYGRLGMKASYHEPVRQHYARGYVLAQSRIDAGVFLLI